LATALSGMPKEKATVILSCLSSTDQRKIQQVIDESKPTPAEISTCIMKILMETRGYILGGILKMEKIAPELMIPDNIEEQLAHQMGGQVLEDHSSSGSEEEKPHRRS